MSDDTKAGKAKRCRLELRRLLATDKMLVVPGAHDPLSARLVEQAGFAATFVGSYAIAASRYGMGDVGLVGREETIASAKAVADAVSIPVIADAEGGWGHAGNVWKTIEGFEQAGVAAIHIEDHVFGKHSAATPVIMDIDEMKGKIQAALEARQDPDFLIIARTDVAWATGDLNETVARLNAYAEIGADLVMPAGIQARDLAKIRSAIHGKVVITDKPGTSVAQEEAAGASIVLYYGLTTLAGYGGVKAALERFKAVRDADACPGSRDLTAEFEAFMGYDDFVSRAQRYRVKSGV